MKKFQNHLLFLIIGIFIFGFIMFEAIHLMNATQLLTTANSRWMKAQKQAISELYLFAYSADEESFESYQYTIVDVMSMRLALEELNKSNPDDDFIVKGLNLMELKNSDLRYLSRLNYYYGKFNRFAGALNSWDEYSNRLDKLFDLAEDLYKLTIDSSASDNDDQFDLMMQIHYLDASLTDDTNTMMKALNEASERLKTIIIRIILAFIILLIIYALFIVYSFIKMQRLLEETNKERKRLSYFPLHNPSPVLELKENGDISYCNDASKKLFPDLEVKGVNHPFLTTIIQDILAGKFSHNAVRVYENNIEGKVYEQVVHHVGQTNSYHMYAFDITSLHKSRANLQEMLDEKTTLLAEVHHRVKNNLAIISGLVQMEIYDSEHNLNTEALERSLSRIHTMAVLHERIYEQNDFSRIDFSTFLKQRIDELTNTLIPEHLVLNQSHHIEPVLINVNQAVPLAMLCNELISNACKHAFNYRKTGLLEVCLIKSAKRLVLLIKDDGPGLSGIKSFADAETLGLSLAHSTASQLCADVDIDTKNGTSISISFNLSQITGTADSYFSKMAG